MGGLRLPIRPHLASELRNPYNNVNDAFTMVFDSKDFRFHHFDGATEKYSMDSGAFFVHQYYEPVKKVCYEVYMRRYYCRASPGKELSAVKFKWV